MLILKLDENKVLHPDKKSNNYTGENNFEKIRIIASPTISDRNLTDLNVELYIYNIINDDRSIFNDCVPCKFKEENGELIFEIPIKGQYTVFPQLGMYLKFTDERGAVGKTNVVKTMILYHKDSTIDTSNGIEMFEKYKEKINEQIELFDKTVSKTKTTKNDLEKAIDTANTATDNLTDITATANTAGTKLQSNITTATELNDSLFERNNQAIVNIEALQDKNFKADEILNGVHDIKAYLGYTDEDIVGLQVDYENRIFKRLAGASGKELGADFDKFPMYGGRKRCIVADDGTILSYFGDEGYIEDGSVGQVMVYQPAFYYRVVPIKLEKNTESGIGYHIRKANYYVTSTPKPGFKLHPAFYDEDGNAVDYILFSAYEGSMWDKSESEFVNDGTNTDTTMDIEEDLICSVAGVKPITGRYKPLSIVNLEVLSSNRGDGWHLETIKAVSANQLLMMIECGTMNMQTAIGQGVVSIAYYTPAYNASSLTGSTNEIGNCTGQATETINEIAGVETPYTESGKVSVSYRGVENPWGNVNKHINGVNIWGDGTMASGQPYIADNFNYDYTTHGGNYRPVGFTLPNIGGSINAMGYGNEEYDWVLMPSEVGGTSVLPVGDHCYVTPNLNDYKTAQFGGSWNGNGIAGGFLWSCIKNVGYSDPSIGGRLLYVPQTKRGE